MKKFLLINILLLLFFCGNTYAQKRNKIIVSDVFFDESVFEQKKDTIIRQKPDTIYKNDSIIVIKQQEVLLCGCPNKKARFAGGEWAQRKWFNNNLRIPNKTRKLCESYEVFCDFTIDKRGLVINVRITKSSNVKILDDEVVRVVGLMPRWIPAEKDYEKIDSDLTIPVTFVFKKKCKNKKINH